MDYRVERLDAFRVVGSETRVKHDEAFAAVPAIWQAAADEGLFERLWAVRAEHAPIRGMLGVCAEGDWGANETFAYMAGIVSEREPADGWTMRAFPPAEWVVFEAEGGPEGLSGLWQRLYTEWLPASGFELADLPAIECYLPPGEGKNELWVPVKGSA